MSVAYAKMSDGGRLLIPAELRRQLGMQPGASVVIDVADGELRVRSVDAAVARAQAIVRRYVPADVNLSEELIRERRKAAETE